MSIPGPRVEGALLRFADHVWHYVPDELAQPLSLDPAGDGEPGRTGCSPTRQRCVTWTTGRRCWPDDFVENLSR